MTFEGVTTKMQTEWGQPIHYYMVWPESFLDLNAQLGKTLTVTRVGYQCLSCGRGRKIFRQGFCFDCFTQSPQAGDWIMRPELSQAHLGIEDRDLAYEQRIQLQPHTVYLAVASDVKVGVTRNSQIPTRWIDQGAHAAIPLLEVPNRYLAGVAEVALKAHFTDKTAWQKMLKNEVVHPDLKALRQQALDWLPAECQPYIQPEPPQLYELQFPVLQYPTKLQSLSLDKQDHFTEVLTGIKGQYLLFESGAVWNVRSHEGYVLRWEVR